MASCGKPANNISRGVTTNGFNLSGLNWNTARTIAADPDIIPLNSKVLIIFYDKSLKKYNGIYSVRDTGGLIKGHKIDFYLGDTISSKILDTFGVRKAKIYIIKDDKQ